MSDVQPTRENDFSFGLWTVGWTARDPFGEATRPELDAVGAVERLAVPGVYGIVFHGDDLIPIGSDDAAREARIKRIGAAVEDTGLVVPLVPTNLFLRPVVQKGGLTSNRRDICRCALRSVDLAAELVRPRRRRRRCRVWARLRVRPSLPAGRRAPARRPVRRTREGGPS